MCNLLIDATLRILKFACFNYWWRDFIIFLFICLCVALCYQVVLHSLQFQACYLKWSPYWGLPRNVINFESVYVVITDFFTFWVTSPKNPQNFKCKTAYEWYQSSSALERNLFGEQLQIRMGGQVAAFGKRGNWYLWSPAKLQAEDLLKKLDEPKQTSTAVHETAALLMYLFALTPL